MRLRNRDCGSRILLTVCFCVEVQQKYFDSGDYNMAKAKGSKAAPRVPPAIPQNPTGETIPTVESLPPRKTSLIQSKLATGLS